MHNLLDSLTDKDESVRIAIQNSLVKILETHPARTVEILSEYRAKHPKLSDQIVSTLLL